MVVLLTVRLPAPLKEGPSAQLLPAAGAGEVLGVPRFAQSCEHLRGDGGAAGAAPGDALGCGERGAGAEARGAHLAGDGLVAGGAEAGGAGGDAQLLQVAGEAAQHVVQRGLRLRSRPGAPSCSRQLPAGRVVRAGRGPGPQPPFPQGLTLLCMWPRSARSSSSCRAAVVGGGEGSSGCGTGTGLLGGTAEREGCCGSHFYPEGAQG